MLSFFNSQQLTWTDIASEGSAELKFEVTSITSTYTISVYWEGSLEKAAQVFTVEFATGTVFTRKRNYKLSILQLVNS